MQKTLIIKLSIIAGLCFIFAIGLNIFRSVIYERQNYADSVVREIAEQHVNPQEVMTPFIAVPQTVTPQCSADKNGKLDKCAAAYTTIKPILANQTQSTQDLKVSTDTYQRGVYHAISYHGDLNFNQHYLLEDAKNTRPVRSHDSPHLMNHSTDSAKTNNSVRPEHTMTHWNQARLIIPVSDLRGFATLPTVTLGNQQLKATYPTTSLISGLSYVEVLLPEGVFMEDTSSLTIQNTQAPNAAMPNTEMSNDATATNTESLNDAEINNGEMNDGAKDDTASNSTVSNSSNASKASSATHSSIDMTIHLPLAGISHLNTVPTGQNFEMRMTSNWHAPKFIGKALPNVKNFTETGFDANWQNQYLTIANNQKLTQCLSLPNQQCSISNHARYDDVKVVTDAYASMDASISNGDSIHLNDFGVSFAEPNDVYLQTERTMKYALLLILVSFGTFFLFEVIKSRRIHPIQYLLVGCALVVFYVLLLPLAEQIVFWKAYLIAATACVGLIGWYAYYMLGSIKRAAIFTAILAGLYASFYGILTTEDLNLLLGAVFCFALIAAVMIMTRKIDWYQVT